MQDSNDASHSKLACHQPDLGVLLFGDDQSAAYRQAAAHVDSCAECQRHLTSLAGREAEWRDVCGLLSGYDVPGDLEPTVPGEPDVPHVEGLAPPRHPELLGRLGRYEVERVIGAGGMGVVFKGLDTELNRPVAIKMLAQHLAHSGAARQRFAREARAAAAVVHEHVVSIHNVDSERQVPFLVMQYVSGESLQARVDRQGPLEAREVLRIGIQAAAGLAAAHGQGVVHRDVKPANILLEHGVDRALLTDFGLARTVDDASLTHTGTVTGTPHYMSPEQARGDDIDHRTDLFSLGAVLYFMATGRPPFRADQAMGVLHRICHQPHRSAWQVNSEVPDGLSDAIDRLLQKKPGRRYANAAKGQDALTETLVDLQRPRTARGSMRRFIRRHRRSLNWAALGATVLAAAVCVLPGFRGSLPVARRAASPDQRDWSWAEYRGAFSAVSERLQQLETAATQSRYLHVENLHWQAELASVHAQLDRLQRVAIEPSQPVLRIGENE